MTTIFIFFAFVRARPGGQARILRSGAANHDAGRLPIRRFCFTPATEGKYLGIHDLGMGLARARRPASRTGALARAG